MKNILLSIDFNGNEHLLIEQAFLFANSFDAKIWLLHVAAPDPDFVGYEPGPQYIRDSRAEDLRKEHQLLQKYANELNARGVEAEGLLIQGPTIEMVIEESEKLEIDMIIIGHQEHNFLYKVFIGSVSDEIVQKSTIPVLLVPLD
ncbi:universal stress protein [Marivirga sp. S37H4]|uniref:Universal stress protein n=1 Tax=Marivirga aurantiaca TaxID=2802615 RepID=A0A935CAZ0_9BACT|nr:universal stress protein [Marivirga aurantiaca]MBK6265078.1 universal stress protein [Marivirga aurantiaca]